MIPDRCRCSHNRSRHELPGFEGECSADCGCKSFRPVDTPTPTAPAPPARPVVAPAPAAAAQPSRVAAAGQPSADQLIAAGRRSGNKVTIGLAARIERDLGKLRTRLLDERASAEARARRIAAKEAARTRILALRAELAEERKKLKGDAVCPEPGCGKTGLVNVGAHRAKAHGYRVAG